MDKYEYNLKYRRERYKTINVGMLPEVYDRWKKAAGETPLCTFIKDAVESYIERIAVDAVTSLQGIVDDETLLSLIWFVKDPAETMEKVKEQKKQAQKNDTHTRVLLDVDTLADKIIEKHIGGKKYE